MSNLYTLLTGTGYSVAYGQFATPKDPPFITYQFSNSDDVYSDDKNYVKKGIWQVELYTNKKDTTAEKKVEDALEGAGLTYSKYEAWIDEEKLWQELYLIEIVEG